MCIRDRNNIKSDGISRMYFDALAKKYKFKLNTPIKDLPKEVLDEMCIRDRFWASCLWWTTAVWGC